MIGVLEVNSCPTTINEGVCSVLGSVLRLTRVLAPFFLSVGPQGKTTGISIQPRRELRLRLVRSLVRGPTVSKRWGWNRTFCLQSHFALLDHDGHQAEAGPGVSVIDYSRTSAQLGESGPRLRRVRVMVPKSQND